MNKIANRLYKNNGAFYKVLLFLITAISIVYLFPKEGKFKYDFSQGKPWLYDNLYAPFDFAIQKTEEEVNVERQEIEDNIQKYFVLDGNVQKEVVNALNNQIDLLVPSDSLSKNDINLLRKSSLNIVKKIYEYGFIDELSESKIKDETILTLRKGNAVDNLPLSRVIKSNEILPQVIKGLSSIAKSTGKSYVINGLSDVLRPNISFDNEFTGKSLKEALRTISYTKGKISKGELIILKGDVVEGRRFSILKSYEKGSKSQIWTKSNYYWIVFGYTILVSIGLLMLLLFLQKYRSFIFTNNNKVTFIFFNVFFFIFIQTLVVKYNLGYIYVVPLSILPIILKAFFDARLALFTHVLTVLLLGFIVPDSFEFIYLHIIAGIMATLTASQLYKRRNLFISIGQITIIYMITYFAFSIIKEGSVIKVKPIYFVLFAANGLLSFLSVFFIYFYEKIFDLVSDITLLELSNTNSNLLRELNDKAPGTFQHSMQVANLAEAAANEIGANSMLVRTGALYHDIGKMANPMYFTENQSTGVNPHNDLSPKDSANIILNHVIRGIEIAKKNNLPDRIIDFIRTHHGTSLVYYFYRLEKENAIDGEVDAKKFQYQGPIPFSKETAILMMCDAAEAASKSLKKPTAQSIDELIDKIIEKQKSENQFINSDITFREIEKIKKVIKNKLMNIYHLRVEYPD